MRITTSEPRFHIKSAVKAYFDLIKTTYGPAGKQVLIVDEYSVKSVDDGKMASQDFELENEFENAVIKYIKEVTDKTEKRVGDGTTTSVILMHALVDALLPDDDPTSLIATNINVARETQNVRKAVKEAISQIESQAKKIKTEKELYDVVFNSCNNVEIAKLISSTLFKLGPNGAFSVEESKGMTTEAVFTEGMEFDRGYVSPYFINKGMGVELQNPAILLVGQKLDNLIEIAPVIQKIVEQGINTITIIAEDFSEELINFFVVNKLRGIINPLLVKSPGYGDFKAKYLQDIAVLTGATIQNQVQPLKDFTFDMVGKADVVRSDKETTIIIGGKGKKKDIEAHIKNIKQEIGQNESKMDTERNEKRIAQLTDGVAILKIGAPTENELKTIKAKAEDAVNAGKVALLGGIVRGGGETFAAIQTSSEILNKALKAPKTQLEENGKDFLDKNTYDPALVQIAALETAVSIALGLANTGGIIAVKREEKENA
jgi:chaperonin GroEL